MVGSRPTRLSRFQLRALSRSYRTRSGAPHEQRWCRSRGSSAGVPQGTEHSRWEKKDMGRRKSKVFLLAEKLRILLLLQLVDLFDVAVGELLDLVEPLALVVLGDLVVFEQLLQPVVRLAADLANAVPSLFAQLVHVARQLFAALFGQRRDRDTHDLSV